MTAYTNGEIERLCERLDKYSTRIFEKYAIDTREVRDAAQVIRQLQKQIADIKPQKSGHWICYDGYQVCSECGEEHCWGEYRAPYCDNCGAEMSNAGDEEGKD